MTNGKTQLMILMEELWDQKRPFYQIQEDMEKLLSQYENEQKEELIRAGQIKLFNRLWEASVGKSDDPIESAYLLMKELNIVREEFTAISQIKGEE